MTCNCQPAMHTLVRTHLAVRDDYANIALKPSKQHLTVSRAQSII